MGDLRSIKHSGAELGIFQNNQVNTTLDDHPPINYLWYYSDVIMGAMASQNNRRIDGLLNRLFRRRSKKTSKLRVTGLCEGNSPVTGSCIIWLMCIPPGHKITLLNCYLICESTICSCIWDDRQLFNSSVCWKCNPAGESCPFYFRSFAWAATRIFPDWPLLWNKDYHHDIELWIWPWIITWFKKIIHTTSSKKQ